MGEKEASEGMGMREEGKVGWEGEWRISEGRD